ncbi:MAG: hypothetical protein ABSG96_15915 [Terracidiphilus sp.]|jgi:hypothetical protein
MKKILLAAFSIKNISVCLLGAALALVAYQHFWAKRILAQSTTTTRIYIPWIGGSDAGYTSLLSVQNTSMDPYGTTPATGTCTADVFYLGTDYSGSLGTIAPGQVTIFTEAQIATATGVALANSGQRGYMFLTCNFPYAHAQALLINPGGVVSFIPGLIVPPNRGFSTGPEQLLQ